MRCKLKDDVCPFCDSQAFVTPPEWDGGRILVNCENCGSFETNFTAIAAYASQIEYKEQTLDWLRVQIMLSSELLHITKNKYGAVTIEPAKPLTKGQKKSRRNNKNIFSATIYYANPKIPHNDK